MLITGAAGGIGQALCQAFQHANYTVYGLDLALGAVNCDRFFPTDLRDLWRDPSRLTRLVQEVEGQLDERGLAALINNAAHQVIKPIEKLTVADWHETLEVNLLAPFLLIQAFLPMLQSAYGCVVNISSIHATLSKPEFTCYATSKAALSGMTRSMALELGQRIRVNAIAPAAVATRMLLDGFADRPDAVARVGDAHPPGRIAEPEEIAAAAVFLCSEAAGFINGAVLQVDGGISARLHDPV